MVKKEQVLDVLKEIFDPELPVNIVDLGLIYDIKISAKDVVTIDMTLTAVGCPMHVFISREIEEKVNSIPGVKGCTVNIVWEPPWTPERMSRKARLQLGFDEPENP